MFYGKYNKGEIRIKEVHAYFSSFFHLYEQILKAGKQPACHMGKLVLATIYLLISLVNYERVLWRKFFFNSDLLANAVGLIDGLPQNFSLCFPSCQLFKYTYIRWMCRKSFCRQFTGILKIWAWLYSKDFRSIAGSAF